MDLNHISLPDFLVEGLYKNHLVENSQATGKAAPPEQEFGSRKAVQFLGNNQKKICLLVNYANDVYLPDNELNFLTSILQACRLNLGDVAIVNNHLCKLSFAALKEQIDSEYLLIFGIPAADLDLNDTPLFSITAIDNCQVIFSPAAEELNNSGPGGKALKGKLWSCLKLLFGI